MVITLTMLLMGILLGFIGAGGSGFIIAMCNFTHTLI